ncbi:hypothetical protein Cgig2_016154 [Carnegiea gigantea]|uniref:Pentatricopeptide repeat-containing protein n=1 Tax=Carnegiea gigantea TaxID=171969 RepID=A0A9Q1KQ22_9CARY|nr:hypothetical protein Cgig2_016154 [Carnegiea gigantea]
MATQSLKHPALTKDDASSLFSQISEILGNGNLALNETPSFHSICNAYILGLESTSYCTPSVCGNAQEKIKESIWRDAHMGIFSGNGNDVSRVVHKITQIVRADDAGALMEEQLDNSSCEVSSEVVCKKFFNWEKLNHGDCLTTESYNTMLYLAGELKEFEMVERLVKEMETSKCVKDIKTWTILLLHYGKAKLVGKSLLIFEKMRNLGFKPNAEAYGLMIHYGDIDGVYLVADNMIQVSEIPEHDVYSCVLRSFCISGRIREALELIQDLKSKNLTLSPIYFEILVKGLCKADKTDDALEIGDIMKKRNVVDEMVYGKDHPKEEICTGDSNNAKPNVKSNYVDSNANCLLVEHLPRTSNEALQTIYTIVSPSKDWSLMQEALEKHQVHYTADLVTEILWICSICGSDVLHFFSWIKKQPGYRHTTDTYNMAIKIAGRGKDFKHMRSLLYEMQRNGCLVTSDTWAIMIMSFGRVGLTDIALRNFREMQACGCKPTVSAYKYLILRLCGRKGGKVEEALKLFKEMMNMGLVTDKELVEGFFNWFCPAGKLAKARKCLEYLCQVGYTTLLSYSLLCRRGKVEEALALTGDVKED